MTSKKAQPSVDKAKKTRAKVDTATNTSAASTDAANTGAATTDPANKARFKGIYRSTVAPALMKQFNYRSAMQVSRVTKVTINMGVGESVNDKKVIEAAVRDMQSLSGQKPVVTKARNSIAGFKIREAWPIGCKVTLRGEKMYEFLDRLVTVAIPRVRDFRGLNPRSFDGHGNYSMGLQEQIVFPEIEYDKIDQLRGMDITVTTSAKTDSEGRALLAAFKFPFKEIK